MPSQTRQKYGEPAHDLLGLCGFVHNASSGCYQPCDPDELPKAVEILTHARDNWNHQGWPPSVGWDAALYRLICATLDFELSMR
jgi:hypothetical protein